MKMLLRVAGAAALTALAGCYLPLQEYPCKNDVDCVGMAGTCNQDTGTCVTPLNPNGNNNNTNNSSSSSLGAVSGSSSRGSSSSAAVSSSVASSRGSSTSSPSSSTAGSSSSTIGSSSTGSSAASSGASGNSSSVAQSSSAPASSSLPPAPVLVITPPATVSQGTNYNFLVTSDVDLQGVPTLESNAFVPREAACVVLGIRQWTCATRISFLAAAGIASATARGTSLLGAAGTAMQTFEVLVGSPGTDIIAVEPPVGMPGATVVVTFNSNVGITGCSLALRDSQSAMVPITPGCALTTSCSCTFAAPSGGDGAYTVVATTTRSDGGTSAGTAPFCLDNTAPVVDLTGAAILRRPVGTPDGLFLPATAAVDPVGPGCAAGVNRVETFHTWVHPLITDLFVSINTQPVTVDLPGTATASSPKQLWLSVVDRAGNEGPRFEIVTGADSTGPALDDAACTAHVLEDAQAEVTCAAGAVRDPGCAPTTLAGSSAPLLTGPVAADGSVTNAPGGVLGSNGTAAVVATDKCGNQTQTELHNLVATLRPGTLVRRPLDGDVTVQTIQTFTRQQTTAVTPLGVLLRAGYAATLTERTQAGAADGTWLTHQVHSDDGAASTPTLTLLTTAAAPAARRSASLVILSRSDTLLLGPGVSTLAGAGSFVELPLDQGALTWSAATPAAPAERSFAVVEPLSGLVFFARESLGAVLRGEGIPLAVHNSAELRVWRQWGYDATDEAFVGRAANGPAPVAGGPLFEETGDFRNGVGPALDGATHHLSCMTAFGGRVALWGGAPGSHLWDGQAWSPTANPWGSQSRENLGCTFDPVRERAVMAGGRAGGGAVTAFHEAAPGGPPTYATPFGGAIPFGARHGISMAWDGRRKRALLFGGAQTDTQVLNDLWEYRPAFPAQQFRAAQIHAFPLHPEATIQQARLQVLARGAAATPVVNVHVWRQTTVGGPFEWVFLGQSTSPATPVAVDVMLVPATDTYRKRVVVMVSTQDESPQPGAATVEVDQAQLDVTYTVP